MNSKKDMYFNTIAFIGCLFAAIAHSWYMWGSNLNSFWEWVGIMSIIAYLGAAVVFALSAYIHWKKQD